MHFPLILDCYGIVTSQICMGYNLQEHMEGTKLLLLVAVILVGVGFLVFIVHTIRCYLNKPRVDDDDEFQVQYQRNDNLHPI